MQIITYQQIETETDKLFKNCFRNLLQSSGQCSTELPGCFEKIIKNEILMQLTVRKIR
jgi:hypothetical protein